MTWFGFFILQLAFIFIIIGLGYWLATKLVSYLELKKTFWIDRVCIGAFVIVLILAISGIIVLLFPGSMRQIVSALVLLSVFLMSAYLFFKRRIFKDIIRASMLEKIFLGGVVVMSGLGLMVSLLPVKMPDHLIDGPYVAKHNYLGVRIQYITGNLPTDNSLPHVVSEYLLRDISFKKERPIMPGQEVSNRPILVPLLLVPIRAAFSLPPKLPDGLPKFNYLNTAWPDFSVLMQDDYGYMFSLSIGIILNALIFLSIGAFAVRAQSQSALVAVGVVALMLTSPYFVFQTIFTWPKELAAFFVLFAIISYVKLKNPILCGAFLAFGYLSHPYAIVFLAGIIIREAYGFLRKEKRQDIEGELLTITNPEYRQEVTETISQVTKAPVYTGNPFLKTREFVGNANIKFFITFLIAFSVLVAPWFLWTKIILDIPSDLVAQNFIQSGQSVIDFIWIRPVNFFKALLFQFYKYPFNLNSMVLGSSVSISGAVGILVFGFSLMYFYENVFERDKVILILIPSLMLIIIFSNPALPALHGLQGPIALMLLTGVMQVRKLLKPVWASIFLGSQLVLNLLLFGRYLYKLV